jgi:hypothetical protein
MNMMRTDESQEIKPARLRGKRSNAKRDDKDGNVGYILCPCGEVFNSANIAKPADQKDIDAFDKHIKECEQMGNKFGPLVDVLNKLTDTEDGTLEDNW